MNRIFRLVWSQRLNALVVVSEIATSRGSLAAGPVVVHLKVPLSVLSLGLALALGSSPAFASDNQSLADLEALTNKYLPVQLDADVALAVHAGVPLDQGTQRDVAVPTLRAKVDVAPLRATPAQPALPSNPSGGLAGLGLDVAAGAQTLLSADVALPLPARVPVPLATVDVSLLQEQPVPAPLLDVAVAVGREEPVVEDLDVQLAVADRNAKGVDADVRVQAAALATGRDGLVGGLLGGVGDLVNEVGGAVRTVGDTVGGSGLLGTLGSGLGDTVGNLGSTLGTLGTALGASPAGITPAALVPGSPKAPAAADPNAGLVIGTGGLVGSVTDLIGPTGQGLFGGDGYVRNGNLAVNSANVMQTYSVTNLLGLPVVNVTPVGTLLDGLDGAVTGGSSHLTLIGGVTSDSYITNINNGDPNGILGLLLPGQAPAWASECVNLLVATIDCWAVNPAQDYQVLMGDGAYANGSREVVIGANARHALPQVDANVAFPGAGLNDPIDPTGVPTADYAARMGHSVVVGDSASGTANGQVLLGAEATSNQANSVALGYRSVANRGAQASYSAFGLTDPQVSAGEVSVGVAGSARQISNVAAGSAATDAVNVAQLQGAISLVNAADIFAVSYDDDGTGQPDYTRVTLGNGGGPTTVTHLANGAVAAGSTDAVNGGQLAATNTAVVDYFGGVTAFDPVTGSWNGPSFAISSISSGGAVAPGVYDNATEAFDAVNSSLLTLNTRITQTQPGAPNPFVQINSSKAAASATGADSIAIGPLATASGAGSTAIGDGATASAGNSVALGSGAVAAVGAELGYTGAFGTAGGSSSAGEVSVGTTGAERKITHVADGSARYDAVNVGQLENGVSYAIDQSKAYTDTQITHINNGTAGMFQVNNSSGLPAPAATGSNSIAGGAGASAGGAGSTALGNGASAQAANAVALGAGSVASRDNTVSVGSAGAERQVTNVGDGTAATDAVNLRQLQASQQGTLHYDSTVNGATNYSSVTLGGSGSGPTTVHNVAAGTAGTDAVNVDQLRAGMNQALDWSKAYTDQRMDGFDRDLRRTDNRASAGVAAAMAVAGLPQPFEAGRSMAAIAAGSYNGESGVAVGIAGVSDGGRWIYKFSGSTNSRGEGGVSVGAGLQW